MRKERLLNLIKDFLLREERVVKKRIFKEGVLLVDQDPELRADLVEYVSLKYRECAGLLLEASLL